MECLSFPHRKKYIGALLEGRAEERDIRLGHMDGRKEGM
jgi:hypothetical protein